MTSEPIKRPDPRRRRREPPPDPNHPGEIARRRRLLIVTLAMLIGLPIYVYVAASVVAWLNSPVDLGDGAAPERPLHWSIEALVYLVLGLVWALPLRGLVQGLGKRAPGS